jgi:uncharacterized membrane protein YagU involved in acid resistance
MNRSKLDKRKHSWSLWQYLLVGLLLDLVTVFVVLPAIFGTTSPVGSPDFIKVAVGFVVWQALINVIGYKMTRG